MSSPLERKLFKAEEKTLFSESVKFSIFNPWLGMCICGEPTVVVCGFSTV